MSILLIYASATGNTREMAEAVSEGIRTAGAELTVKPVLKATPEELADYDGVVLGAYTWGDGELPDEFLVFYDRMEGLTLQGKTAAVFGSCDSQYEQFGAAVDLLEARLRETGAELILPGLKVELAPGRKERRLCAEFGAAFARQTAAAASNRTREGTAS